MNSCILMAQVVTDPELRATQDQTNVATMLVEFESTREGEAPGQVKVEGWGNLAETIKSSYRVGSQIIIEGRLSMNTVEMPEGYKQKVAKLVASRIFPVDGVASNLPSGQQPSNVVDFAPNPATPAPAPTYAPPAPASEPTPAPVSTPASGGNEDWDEIPF
ncbi:MAG: single-stranded DNA-binding protein [Cyanobacteria bacterium J06600_6]